jgi:hypothetical protein
VLELDSQERTKDLALLLSVKFGSGNYPTAHQVVIKGYFSGAKRSQLKDDSSPQYSANVRNEWSFTSSPTHIFM